MALGLGVRALGTLSASYVLGRPFATLMGAPAWARPGLVPACVAWSAGLAASGAVAAMRVGLRVRRAPILHPRSFARLDELTPICSLVSDTHVVAAGAVPSELALEPAQWPFPWLDVSARLRSVLAAIHRDAPRTVIWCGDEVDSGDPAEWAAWRDVVASAPGLAHRLVPGNHDICFNHPFDEDHALARRTVRERAYEDHAGPLAQFPLVDTIIGDGGPAHVILLDSCRHRSTHVLSNAIGRLGDDQLDALARVLAGLRGPVLVVMHHHPWRDARFAPEAWFNTAVDADRLVSILGAYRDPVLVCHGHRHVATAGTIGDGIAVVGLPSSTLGDKSVGDTLDGVLRYGVAGLRRGGGWGVALVEIASEFANT